MGSVIGTAMDESMKKNQQFMVDCQNTMLARQLRLQRQMQHRQMSMMIAGSREMFTWIASFYGIATVATFVGFMKSKKPAVLVPFLPLSFVVGYQADYTYGTKIDRIRAEAERILREEQGLLALPNGFPTLDEIEQERLAAEAKTEN